VIRLTSDLNRWRASLLRVNEVKGQGCVIKENDQKKYLPQRVGSKKKKGEYICSIEPKAVSTEQGTMRRRRSPVGKKRKNLPLMERSDANVNKSSGNDRGMSKPPSWQRREKLSQVIEGRWEQIFDRHCLSSGSVLPIGEGHHQHPFSNEGGDMKV